MMLKDLDVTPALTKFAESGTRFEQAHVMHTQCSPSRCTMMTGRYMHVLGHRTQTHLIRAYEMNYFRLLKESGYHVLWLGKNDALSEIAFNLSVTSWEHDYGYDSGTNRYDFNTSGYYSMLFSGSNVSATETGDYAAVEKAIKFLKSPPEEPFVIFLPTRGAHPPYGVPREFQNKFTLDEVKAKVQLRPRNVPGKPRYHSRKIGIPFYRNLTGLEEDTFYEIQRQYLSMLSFTDWTFGKLLDGLKESGLEDRTAVFFSSDHGDFGGDYGLVEKYPGAADDILTRVPLVARIPGGKKNHTVRAPVQIADIMETMVTLAKINTSFVRFAKSLAPEIMDGQEGDLSRYVYSEGGFYYRSELFPGGSDHVPNDPRGLYWPRAQEEMSNNGTGSPRWVMIRNLTSKLVFRPHGISELYNLTNDPRELSNVYDVPKYQALQHDLMWRIAEWQIRTGDVPTLRVDPRGLPTDPYPITQKSCETLLQPDPKN
eukprot:g194.t1